MAPKDEKKDVEMKDAEKKDEKKEEIKEIPKDPKTLLIEAINSNLQIMITAVNSQDLRVLGRVIRSMTSLRRTMRSDVLSAFIEGAFDPKSPSKDSCLALVPKVTMADEPIKVADLNLPKDIKNALPEVEAFLTVLLLGFLIDQKEPAKAMECADALIKRLKNFNRRSLDQLNARAYFLFARVYELAGRISEIRNELLAAYRTACLHHDSIGQATLLNLCIRNYLNCNLVEQAWKLVSKTSFPESRPNAQYARYLYYIGRIKAIQLEYSDAHSRLTQALRKAPQAPKVALGFKVACNKLAIIVELLMGGIPDRLTFTQKELREPLAPYFAITQAVRSGDLKGFQEVQQQHEALFKQDKTFTLINRLRYNVIKSGLRGINLSYSRISLQDICTKLGLESVQDAAGVIAKAVVDGVIEATIDHEGQFLKSNPRVNLYSSAEPQKSLHKRVAFCLQLHNDAIKAMAYPDDKKDEKALTAEALRERENAQLAELDEEGDDDML